MEINAAGPGGEVSPDIEQRYLTLARGGWGIIVVEALSVTETSLARRNQLVMTEENVPRLQSLVAGMKQIAPETLIFLQVSHAGVISNPDFSRCVSVWPPATHRAGDPRVEMVADEEIAEIEDQYVRAFLLAEQSGADGIDFKACHGYLVAEFLRPANLRSGPYGGDLGNRLRFFQEVVEKYKQVRTRADFCFGTRFSFFEGVPGGFGSIGPDSVEEYFVEPLAFVTLCREIGLDFVNVTAGIPAVTPEVTRPTVKTLQNMDKHFEYQRATKDAAGEMAVIGSGYSAARLDLPEVAAQNLRDGVTDFVGLGRQNLAEPLYPQKFRDGGPALCTCTLCGGCSDLLKAQEMVGCVAYDRVAMKRARDLRRAEKQLN